MATRGGQSRRVRVAIRVRGGSSDVDSVFRIGIPAPDGIQIQMVPEKSSDPEKYKKLDPKALTFQVDYAFDSAANQADVWSALEKDVLDSVFGTNGHAQYGVTLMAYGQTGSGKTHTMMGPESCKKNPLGKNGKVAAEAGLILRTAHAVLSKIEDVRKQHADIQYAVTIGMIEIYKEKVNDLLTNARFLQVRENRLGFFVMNQQFEQIQNLVDVAKIVTTGYDNATMASTNMNERSSRAHTIITIKVHTTASKNPNPILAKWENCAKVILVDLAGSENAQATNKMLPSSAKAGTQEEGIKINLSLGYLGNMIEAAQKGDPKQIRLQAKNSILTKLLLDSIGGSTVSFLMVAVRNNPDYFKEIKVSLEFGQKAKKVVNRPMVMMDAGNLQTRLKAMQDERDELKRERDALLQKLKFAGGSSIDMAEFHKRIELLQEQLDTLHDELTINPDLAEDVVISFFDNIKRILTVESVDSPSIYNPGQEQSDEHPNNRIESIPARNPEHSDTLDSKIYPETDPECVYATVAHGDDESTDWDAIEKSRPTANPVIFNPSRIDDTNAINQEINAPDDNISAESISLAANSDREQKQPCNTDQEQKQSPFSLEIDNLVKEILKTPSFPNMFDLSPELKHQHFHFMISYRASTEGEAGNEIAKELFNQINLLSAMRKPLASNSDIPLGLHPKYASNQNENSDMVRTFLGSKCLRQGLLWEEGFGMATLNSIVLIPILSFHASSRQGKYTGSLGQLSELDPPDKKDWQDNFLLEITIANALMELPGERRWLQSIIPLLLGERGETGYKAFDFGMLGKLSNYPSLVTNRKAALTLLQAGYPVSEAMLRRSIRENVDMVLKYQGIQMDKYGMASIAIEYCAKEAIKKLVQIRVDLYELWSKRDEKNPSDIADELWKKTNELQAQVAEREKEVEKVKEDAISHRKMASDIRGDALLRIEQIREQGQKRIDELANLKRKLISEAEEAKKQAEKDRAKVKSDLETAAEKLQKAKDAQAATMNAELEAKENAEKSRFCSVS